MKLVKFVSVLACHSAVNACNIAAYFKPLGY
nr:MAG TPA: hypothetical protein [Caudoviricetes sp.]